MCVLRYTRRKGIVMWTSLCSSLGFVLKNQGHGVCLNAGELRSLASLHMKLQS
jgi:hypothetical protein